MSGSESPHGPRRSQRERKQAYSFRSSQKRKRDTAESNDDDDDRSERHFSDVDDAPSPDENEHENYGAQKPRGKPAALTKKRGKPKTTKRTRVAKDGELREPSRKSKKAQINGDASNTNKVPQDFKINTDNALFNAIMNPSAALQLTVEDFLESLKETPEAAQAELVNCILRACGCNDSVNQDEAVDYDGVVDALDNFTEALKQDDSPLYPLTSKLPIFKKFRRSLSEFLERLIVSAAEVGVLYTTDLMATIQTWITCMSSSQLRSFRHTATVVALEILTALCDVAASVEKEAGVLDRQRAGEKKRKAGNKTKATTSREKELESRAAEVRERKTNLDEFLKELVDSVFVNRYRDLDPSIRAECVRSIGLWFKKYPGYFLDGLYLRYVGWVLSDSNTQVRLEAVKSLSGVYENADYIGSVQTFTERFKPRLVEMAARDTELAVRVAVIGVLGAIDAHQLLEDEQREELCILVFDEDAKVRKAVSEFVRGVWAEIVEEVLGNGKGKQERTRAGVKALGKLLVRLSKPLGKKAAIAEDDEDSFNGVTSGSALRRVREVAALVGAEQRGRIALAVEALWDDVEPVSEWETLLDILLLDHSANTEGGNESRGRRSKGNKSSSDSVAGEAWRLEEVEEAVLLEVFVASLRKARASAVSAKKGEEDTVVSDITRALIKSLPLLFTKHQTDEARIAVVLSIPLLMNLDLYLEMRMTAAYASLWDDVTKQFTSHSSPVVLSHAVAAIRHLMDATSLSNTNNTKILELEDKLATSLRDTVAGRDELEIASFTEDEVLLLGAICARLSTLAGARDMSSWMEEDEGGKQSSAWDIISALLDRGRLGYKEEEAMIDQALNVLTLHVIWKARRLPTEVQPSPDDTRLRESFLEQRETLLKRLVEYAVGSQSNTTDGVRRAAFQNLLNLHILFCPPQDSRAEDSLRSSLSLTLDEEVQIRCAAFVQAEIEYFTEEVAVHGETAGDDGSGDEGVSGDDDATPKKGSNKKGKKPMNGTKETRTTAPAGKQTTRAQLEQEYVFMGVISTFLRAIRAGAIHPTHSVVLLTHHGRLGVAFDHCSKIVVDVLREEGMYKGHGDVVVDVVTSALRDSFTLLLEDVEHDEAHSISLAKSLVPCLMMRGAQLAVVRKLDGQHVVSIHSQLLAWIAKRLGAYESNSNKRSRDLSVLFFKVLQPLLAPVDSRDALTIKAYMDQVLAQAKVKVSPTSSAWEPQRAYERRLVNIMSKSKGGAPSKHRGRAVGKPRELATSDEESGEQSGEDAPTHQQPVSQQPPRPRPAYRTRSASRGLDAASAAGEEAGGDHHRSIPENDAAAAPVKKKIRAASSSSTRRSVSRGSRSRTRSLRSQSRGQSSASSGRSSPEPPEGGERTPRASRKRRRAARNEEERRAEVGPVGEGDDDGGAVAQGEEVDNSPDGRGAPSSSSPARASSSRASSAGAEFRVLRKRARH
ncbi:hypothetical protein EDB92DRAFT_1935195 [Lactarius akahatsu]|uniref:SCD domain-containing protein n=1 Tax=Lactarius akahatsu TaxID=416441 RepID=A0AAD4LGI1_9AGAM|nr:hypothetical protein EDB92DRAFT_1935195 [Lactarius akahatsu]